MTILRTFIAIVLDDELKHNIRRLQDGLREQVPPRSIRWVRPEGIHLTLKFLGNTPSERVERLQAALERAAETVEPFDLTVRGLGCFPNARRPRVVWVGLEEPTGKLAALRQAIEDQVAPLGFPAENRPFRPHLTLGRVQRQASKSEAREIGEMVSFASIGTIDEMSVNRVSYIKSDLRSSGAVYTTLSKAELGGNIEPVLKEEQHG
jgi:2'-5' RNA ligase